MESVYNDREHSATKTTLFYADMGRHLYKATTPRTTKINPTAEGFAKNMHQIGEEVGAALTKAKSEMKRMYDRKTIDRKEYKPSDKVWLDARNIKTT